MGFSANCEGVPHSEGSDRAGRAEAPALRQRGRKGAIIWQAKRDTRAGNTVLD